MARRLAVVILLSVVASLLVAQEVVRPTDAELAATTARGRMLARYDVVAEYAVDALLALKPPPKGRVGTQIATADGDKWKVAFGHLEGNRFLVGYEAFQGATPKEFTVKAYDPPQEDTGFYLSAAQAFELVRKEFGSVTRPYKLAALPAPDHQLYVYRYPAQTVSDIHPIGGDARYLVSGDGSKIIEKRQMHKTVLDIKARNVPSGAKVAGGYHTHFLSDVPEDTDVFHVLARKPSMPEMIGTEHFVYGVKEDGSIKVVQEIKRKDKKK